MIILLIGMDVREDQNSDFQYLGYTRQVSISFLNGFIDNESKSETMETKIATVINFLPTYHQERFIVKVEKPFLSHPFCKPLQKSLTWTVSEFKKPCNWSV